VNRFHRLSGYRKKKHREIRVKQKKKNPKRVYAVRGAVCIKENTVSAIHAGVNKLVRKLLDANRIKHTDVVSIVFSVTPDLDAENPARSVRKGLNLSDVPLFCCVEPGYPDSLPRTIRTLLTLHAGHPPRPVYLDGAEVLRPDIGDIDS
jgi:chorismate mutase